MSADMSDPVMVFDLLLDVVEHQKFMVELTKQINAQINP